MSAQKKLRKQSFRDAPELKKPSSGAVEQVVRILLEWGPVRRFPWRNTPKSPYQILITEILLARTSAEGVAGVIEELWSHYPTPVEMANAEVDEIKEIIRPLGLLKRAGMLRMTATKLIENNGIPSDPNKLRNLPGVGRYVRDAFRLFALDEAVIPIDAVIGRVIRRIFGFPNFGPAYADKSLWNIAQILASTSERRRLVASILDLGALICLPEKPKCPICPVYEHCAYFRLFREYSKDDSLG